MAARLRRSTDARILGWTVQGLFALVVPLLVLPLAFAWQPFAFLFALGLGLLAAAPVVGLANLGSAFLIVGIATSPLNAVRPVPALGWMELCDPFLVLGFALLVPHFVGTRLRLPTAFIVGAAGLLTIGTVSALATEEPAANFGHLLDVAQGVVVLPILLTWWRPSLRMLATTAFAYMIGNAYNVLYALSEGPDSGDRYSGLTTHPNVLGLCQVLGIGLAPFLLAVLPRRHHWVVGLSWIISMYGIWLSGSRAALLVAVALTLLYPVFNRSIPAAIAVGALGFIAAFIVTKLAPTVDPTSALGRLLGVGDASRSDEARRLGAEQGFEQFLNHPILGDGWLTVWGAHNAYLQVPAAIGLFGFVAYLLLLTAFLKPLVTIPRPYGLLAAPALASVVLDLALPILGARYVWVVVGLALAGYRLGVTQPSTPDRHAPRTLRQL